MPPRRGRRARPGYRAPVEQAAWPGCQHEPTFDDPARSLSSAYQKQLDPFVNMVAATFSPEPLPNLNFLFKF
jgi:hypothetical protein